MNKIQLLLRIAIIIFLVEGMIMLGLSVLGPMSSPGLEALIDAVVLIMIVTPIMNYWVINPYIKARNHVERELARIGRKNEQLLNTAGEGIFGVDIEGRTTFINSTAAKMIGHKPEDLIGRAQHDTFHHTRQDSSPYPVEECPICATYRDGKVHSMDDEVFWRKDGTGFPVELMSTPIREDSKTVGAVVTFKDITKRKQMEEELIHHRNHLEELVNEQTEDLTALKQNAEDSRQILQLILDTIPVRVFWKDIDLNYLGCNKLFAQDAGYKDSDELIGLSDFEMGWRDQAAFYRADD
ncbi:PAS domain-containing protein [endosymbiont of Lamellibrachia barhami]|uniref:PAS domain-containing protein n=1 Tax=endosymbiont of Lamellibrachia barhami TaxID=205975 RepID=UPI0015A92EE2|nr:PAS domain S-box protein [endosymbiont of Lamellibrachia barhami]